MVERLARLVMDESDPSFASLVGSPSGFALEDQIQRRQGAFSQVGEFLRHGGEQLSEEQSTRLQGALDELERANLQLAKYRTQLEHTGAKIETQNKTIENLRSTSDALRDDVQKLNDLVVGEQQQFALSRTAWSRECADLRDQIFVLKAKNESEKQEYAQFKTIQSTNQRLNDELQSMSERVAETAALKRTMSAMQAQLSNVEREKSEMSR